MKTFNIIPNDYTEDFEFLGWGTSACWWSPSVPNQKVADDIANKLFSKDGLGINIYRYNVGAGWDPENVRVTDPWRIVDSFYVFDKEEETGHFDFSRCENDVRMLKAALDTGNVDEVILFANSPHYSQTSSGQASGSLLYHTCNLPMSKYQAFVDYFLDITEYFIEMGVPVHYISPINEPQWKWGGTHVWQEGCHYEAKEIVQVLYLFAKEIEKRKLDVKLYAPESGEMLGLTRHYLSKIKKNATIMRNLGVFAYHSYHADNSPKTRINFKKQIVDKNPDIRFDMSEWCELPNKSHSKNFMGALIIARIISQDISLAKSVTWTNWVAINGISIKEDGQDYSDGLMSASPNFSEYYINERYYGFAHFSKYVEKGATVLDTGFYPDKDNQFNISAFSNPNGEKVFVLMNEGKDMEISFPSKDFKDITLITSKEGSHLKESALNDDKFTLEEKSIVTIIAK